MRIERRAMAAIAMLTMTIGAQAQAAGIKPGKWEISSTVKSLEMADVPPQVRRSMIGKTTTTSVCITPEQAARGPQDMFKTGAGCKFTRQMMVGTRIDTEMVCRQGGSTMTARSSGSFTPTSFSATGTSTMSGPMRMSSTAVSSGKWVGACRK